LGSEEFGKLTKRANELNSKLLEVEKTYGQFGRNVGNYPDTMAQGFSKFKIEVNGTIREFDNARQALKELTNERNTLKLMGEDFGNLDEVVKTLKSDIKDMEMSSATMDNLLDSMQGLIALGSTAEGFAALFGFDNKAIEETIKKLVALQNILQGIEVIKKQMQTGEGIGGMFAKGNAAIDKFSASLLGVSTNAKAAKKGLTEAAAANVTVTTTSAAATVAVKALSFALKTVGIGIILTAVAFLVEGLQSLIEWFTKADDAAEKAKKVNEECAKSYAEAKSKLTQYSEKVKNFNGTKQQEKKLVEELNNQLGKELGTYKTLAEWQKVLKENGDAYCDSMLNQARAQAALNAVTEAYINLQQVQANIASGEYHHW
jgi:DNA repair exonuclease SbcCD ATPase subunit